MKVYIITSAKFEECYIEEWVQYHLNIGFDKIIINDNNPKDYPYNPKDILKKYIDGGQVIVERYYDIYEHNKDPEDEFPEIYTWLYNKYKNEFDWCAKLDIDEYLEIQETNNDIKKFLSQKKFKNVLTICVPLIPFEVKSKYCEKYTRLKFDRDRFQLYNFNEYIEIWRFKSIIKKDPNVSVIGHHLPCFYNYNINKCYALPDANGFFSTFLFDINNNLSNSSLVLKQQKKYFYYLANNICKINHYCLKSHEEFLIKILKYEGNAKGNLYNEEWNIHYKYSKDYFNNPRDLYKLYFIDNINNIK